MGKQALNSHADEAIAKREAIRTVWGFGRGGSKGMSGLQWGHIGVIREK